MAKEKMQKSIWGKDSIYTEKNFYDTKTTMLEKFHDLKKKIQTLKFGGISNSYFLFDQPVLYFNDTRKPDWEWAIWGDVPYKDVKEIGITYYGDHKFLVDKFKPSRTWVSTESADEFISILNDIAEREELNYYASNLSCEVSDLSKECVEDGKVLTDEDILAKAKELLAKDKKFKKDESELMKKVESEVIEEYLEKIFDKVPFLSGIGFLDGDKDGSDCYPRFDILVSVDLRKLKKDFYIDMNYELKFKKRSKSKRSYLRSYSYLDVVSKICSDVFEEINCRIKDKYEKEYSKDLLWDVKSKMLPHPSLLKGFIFTSYTKIVETCDYWGICRNEGHDDYDMMFSWKNDYKACMRKDNMDVVKKIWDKYWNKPYPSDVK